jgi:hypothetical protein
MSVKGCKWLDWSGKVGMVMVLTEEVCFKAVFQKGNRVQVPKRVRWQFKLDSKQVLRVTLRAVGSFKKQQSFFTQMGKDGRITIPEVQRELLKPAPEKSLVNYIFEVTLEPVFTDDE